MNLFLSKLSLMDWNTDEIHKVIHDLCDFVGIKSGKVMPDLRRAICGTLPGPEMPVIMSIMSKDDVRSRIEMLLVPNLA
jgi:glutamyl/glutaminyl-tRNA synthetase